MRNQKRNSPIYGILIFFLIIFFITGNLLFSDSEQPIVVEKNDQVKFNTK